MGLAVSALRCLPLPLTRCPQSVCLCVSLPSMCVSLPLFRSFCFAVCAHRVSPICCWCVVSGFSVLLLLRPLTVVDAAAAAAQFLASQCCCCYMPLNVGVVATCPSVLLLPHAPQVWLLLLRSFWVLWNSPQHDWDRVCHETCWLPYSLHW